MELLSYISTCELSIAVTAGKNFCMGCTFMVSDFIKNWWKKFLIKPCLGVIYE